MDVIFNCPKCDQELAVDSSGSGSEIECPSCGQAIVIPELENAVPRPGLQADGNVAPPRAEPRSANPISSSAAAKVELHLKVPSNKASESLIAKPLPPMDVAAARDTEKKIKVKTIRHTDCIEVGHDKFDEMVSATLGKIGEPNIVSITTISYSYVDIGSQKLITDFGVLIIYKG